MAGFFLGKVWFAPSAYTYWFSVLSIIHVILEKVAPNKLRITT